MGKKTPYGQIFTNVPKPHRGDGNTSFCANFVKFGRPEVGEIARYLMDKKKISALPPEATSARIAPKICQGQLRTMYSEFPKFHPNPFTSGGVIAERVNIVQTRHKVFAILSEASASSPSNKIPHEHLSLSVGSSIVPCSAVVHDFGVLLDSELYMKHHISKVTSTCYYHLRRLHQIRNYVSREIATQS